jgi:hypothetical protein
VQTEQMVVNDLSSSAIELPHIASVPL